MVQVPLIEWRARRLTNLHHCSLPARAVSPPGLQVIGDARAAVQSVLVTVLARRPGGPPAPGTGQDRATVQVLVAAATLPLPALGMARAVKTLTELPPR